MKGTQQKDRREEEERERERDRQTETDRNRERGEGERKREIECVKEEVKKKEEGNQGIGNEGYGQMKGMKIIEGQEDERRDRERQRESVVITDVNCGRNIQVEKRKHERQIG